MRRLTSDRALAGLQRSGRPSVTVIACSLLASAAAAAAASNQKLL